MKCLKMGTYNGFVNDLQVDGTLVSTGLFIWVDNLVVTKRSADPVQTKCKRKGIKP